MNLTFEEIKSRYDIEWKNRGEARTADDIPMGWDLVTPEWMTSILVDGDSGARVVSVRLGDKDEGTSSRRRLYLDYNEAGKAAGLPASVFCKSTHGLENRYIIGMNGGIEAEVTFYNVVAPELGIEVPKCYFARFDPDTLNSIIVMKDMAGEVEFCSDAAVLTLEHARSQMELLARLHSAYYESDALDTKLSAWNTWEDYFAITAREAGFEDACQRGFAKAKDVIPPALFAREAEIWPATVTSIALHAKLPRTLVHSDVHLKNWYIAGPGKMGLNDWQCSSKGHWSRDLSYALSTCLSVERRREWEKDLLAYYLDCMHGAGVPQIAF
ncbi:MAG: phosphotransferase, partial [Rhodospirillales bacterium]|nr:phosphotransferase [Rhodospirillales bacterium]